MIVRYIKDPPYLVREKGKVDFAGLFFMALGLGALLVMLEKATRKTGSLRTSLTISPSWRVLVLSPLSGAN